MQAKIRPAVLAAVIAIAGLVGLTLEAATPRPLYAQTCADNDGNLCAQDCMRECSNGSCCAWLFYYYPKKDVQIQ